MQYSSFLINQKNDRNNIIYFEIIFQIHLKLDKSGQELIKLDEVMKSFLESSEKKEFKIRMDFSFWNLLKKRAGKIRKGVCDNSFWNLLKKRIVKNQKGVLIQRTTLYIQISKRICQFVSCSGLFQISYTSICISE